MVDLVTLQAVAYVAQIVGVVGTLTAAFIGVRSYINSNKHSEEAKKKEQETRERELETQKQTLETRQVQMFMSIYNQTTTKDFNSAWNTFTAHEWRNFGEFNETLQDKEFAGAYHILGMFYEGLGVLVKLGYLDIRLVALLICGMTRSYWEKYIPVKDEIRSQSGFSRWQSETEYLYLELMRYLVAHPELDTRVEKPRYA